MKGAYLRDYSPGQALKDARDHYEVGQALLARFGWQLFADAVALDWHEVRERCSLDSEYDLALAGMSGFLSGRVRGSERRILSPPALLVSGVFLHSIPFVADAAEANRIGFRRFALASRIENGVPNLDLAVEAACELPEYTPRFAAGCGISSEVIDLLLAREPKPLERGDRAPQNGPS